jgi:hypothetical protein
MALRLSVQQQNEARFAQMLATAQRYRGGSLPVAVQNLLRERGIDLTKAAFVRAEDYGPVLGYRYGFAGLLVTPERRFFEVEAELNEDGTEVITLDQFLDVTPEQNLSVHNPGIGQGDGHIAVLVLDHINGGKG